jgi:hypothetical protein
MKTPIYSIKRFITLLLAITMMFAVQTSCKKKDDSTSNPTPTPTPTPVVPMIQNRLPQLRTYKEIRDERNLPGYILGGAGSGLSEIDWQADFFSIGDIMWDIHDFKHTEAEFQKIDNQLSSMQNQLTQISAQLNELAVELQLGVVDIESWISNSAVHPFMVDIATKFQDSTSQYSLMYFPAMAARIKRGDPTAIPIKTLQTFELTYVLENNNPNVTNNINQLFDQIQNQNALKIFTQKICLNDGVQSQANLPANVMNAYLLLEGYFCQILNYQLQGMAVVANVDNAIDTTHATWKTKLTGFQSMIKTELQQFLTTVDYLNLNLYNFRNQTQYTNDATITSCQLGVAPDQVFLDVDARAQFLCNVVLDAFALPYPSVGVKIVTPHNYTDGSKPIVNTINVTVGGGSTSAVNCDNSPNGLSSQFPNTTYNASTYNCSPDNHWNVYRLTGGNLLSGSPAVVIQDGGDKSSPWAHDSQITGNVKVLYYNPMNGKSSPTKDSIYSIPFGFFSAVWYWGYQFPMSPCPTYFFEAPGPEPFTTNNSSPVIPNPGIVALNTENFGITDYTPQFGKYFTYPSSHQLGYNGNMVGLGDSWELEIVSAVIAAPIIPSSTANGCMLFSTYSTDSPDFTVDDVSMFVSWIGDGFWDSGKWPYYSNQKLLWAAEMETYNISGFKTEALDPMLEYNINYGFQFTDKSPSGSSIHEMSVFFSPSVVFKDTYPISK